MPKLHLLIPFCFLLFSCANEKRNTDPIIVAAEKTDSRESYSSYKSYRSDMVDEAYETLKKDDKSIADLEKALKDLGAIINDSTENFDEYHSRNLLFYSSANSHLEGITDSILRNRMKFLIQQSKSNYERGATNLRAIRSDIDSQSK